MGILDDAIREHLELKRHHGADESEVEELEAEAFGPADRPDATEPTPDVPPTDPPSFESEAMTQVISPGSAITVPAGEGDQLDKVFEAKREEQATEEHAAAEREAAEAEAEPAVEEHSVPEQEAVEEPEAASEPEVPAAIADRDEATGAGDEGDDGEGDAGDALELERQHLAGQPTEHYDVDAAMAEEDEIDLLSESRLADELDRALEGPEDGPAAPAAPAPEPQHEVPDAAGPESQHEVPDAAGPESQHEVPDAAEPDFEPTVPSPDDQKLATGEVVEGEEQDLDDSEFFDQDDPLEGTPDFLEETPEHDRLWFEQKEPKDFDFGD